MRTTHVAMAVLALVICGNWATAQMIADTFTTGGPGSGREPGDYLDGATTEIGGATWVGSRFSTTPPGDAHLEDMDFSHAYGDELGTVLTDIAGATYAYVPYEDGTGIVTLQADF